MFGCMETDRAIWQICPHLYRLRRYFLGHHVEQLFNRHSSLATFHIVPGNTDWDDRF